MALPAGLEPATSGLENRCSIQLSYGSNNCPILIRQKRSRQFDFLPLVLGARL